MSNILFLDIETTGLPPKGAKYDVDYELFPYIVQMSYICTECKYEYTTSKEVDHIIKPYEYKIPEESIKIHGITNEYAIENGVNFLWAIQCLLSNSYYADKIVGHNLYFDISIIKANIIRYFGINSLFYIDSNKVFAKEKRFDTMYKAMQLVKARQENGSGKFPTLVETYFYLFGETFPAHNSLEDCRATKRCYEELLKR